MKNKFLAIFLLFFIVLGLTGCGEEYNYALGDSGYINEIDFRTHANEIYKKAEAEGEDDEVLSFTYIDSEGTYVVSIDSMISKAEYAGKKIKISAGRYNAAGEYEPIDAGLLIELENEWYTNTYEFEATGSLNDIVIKIEFGTNLEDGAKAARGANTIRIKNFTLTKQGSSVVYSLLTEKTYKGSNLTTVVTKDNNSLCYAGCNTGTCSYAANEENPDQEGVLNLTLNYFSKGPVWQWIVNMFGKLLNWLTQALGGWYWLAVLIFTVAIRSLGWPIYAKSNSFSSNLSSIQPEMEKINQKYAGKTDSNSKAKQQMELRALMKKNKISIFGCLLPFLQMPIFLWVYQVVRRFPITPQYIKTTNFKFLWTSFAVTGGVSKGDVVLAILVGVTMIASQLLTTWLQKRIAKKRQNFYTAKNQQNNKSTLIIMIVMTAMMVVFAWNSAGIAFYWIIGNLYQIAQTVISKYAEAKKIDKKQRESGRPAGR